MKNIYLLLLSVMLGACNDFLTVTPKGVVSPTTIEDYDLLLAKPASYLGDEILYSDPDVFLTDDIILRLSNSTENIYKWGEYFYLEGEVSSNWVGPYSEIYNCNLILDNVDTAPSDYDNDVLRSEVKGEALARRATAYFFLVNHYGKHYNKQTSNSDLGVPLVLTKTITPKLPRATVKKIYEQIEADLLEALDLVTEYPEFNTRMGKAAVNAILSKMYLYMANFKQAEFYANEAIGNDFFLYDFKEESMTREGNAWKGTSLPTLEEEYEEILFSNAIEHYFDRSPIVYYSQSLLDIFDQENDLRFVYFATDHSSANLPLDGVTYTADIPRTCVACVPEIMLIQAEAMIRNEKVNDGINLINRLRKSRFVEGADCEVAANSMEEALNIVIDEYRREFAFTGLNWMNLKRLRSQGFELPEYSRSVKGITYTLSRESNLFVFPIPRREINMNSLLEPNNRKAY